MNDVLQDLASFAGATNPSYVFTAIDDGPNAASIDDVKVLTDSLGYVMSQASAFLLDSDDTSSFDFPANYVVLNFAIAPPLAVSAALFETVGRIDRDLFATDTSGYTQIRSRVSLSPVGGVQRAVHRRLRACRRGIRRRVHTGDQWDAVALPGRGCLPWERLDGQYAR